MRARLVALLVAAAVAAGGADAHAARALPAPSPKAFAAAGAPDSLGRSSHLRGGWWDWHDVER